MKMNANEFNQLQVSFLTSFLQKNDILFGE